MDGNRQGLDQHRLRVREIRVDSVKLLLMDDQAFGPPTGQVSVVAHRNPGRQRNATDFHPARLTGSLAQGRCAGGTQGTCLVSRVAPGSARENRIDNDPLTGMESGDRLSRAYHPGKDLVAQHGGERSERFEDRAGLVGQIADVGAADTGNQYFQFNPTGVGQSWKIAVDETDAAGRAENKGVRNTTKCAAK